jgi:outer membrane lipoprotein-sorting protein
LFGQIETRRQTLTSLRGLARLVYKDSQDKGTAKQAIAVAAPDRFRWELFSPIGVAALVTSDGQVLSTYFPSEKVLYRGAATPENVARFTRVQLSPREVVGLLLGAPTLPSTRDFCTVRLDVDRDWYQLHCSDSAGDKLDLWFERKTLWLRRAETSTAAGMLTKRMELADYRTVGDQKFPFEIVLSDFQNQQQASILYERVELNPHPSDSIFTLAAISGVREIDVDAFNP